MKQSSKKSAHQKDFNIVLLSSFNSGILLCTLEELYKQGFVVRAIILDGIISDKNRKIITERTSGFFDWPDFSDIETYEVPVFFVKDHNGAICEKLLHKINPDVVVNAGTPRILKKHILSIPSRGVVNSHPGILPKYRGCTVVEWAIYNDDPVGATCHFMDTGIDNGPIIYSEVMSIHKGDVYKKIRSDIILHSIKVLVKGLQKIHNENLYFDALPMQQEGSYYNVIPDDKLEVVKKKLSDQKVCKLTIL